ncbi:rhophilin-1 isoform X4 [Oryctolagus cuniculus]|uniref:rhophilin-1 isoform X4 n=1 Tax=Oryctolagus cuniculus TaxID=9986 RepID=UPI00222EE58A|nr:rhophilin-1 isoform X4 [Oryctolagus cuniculus]
MILEEKPEGPGAGEDIGRLQAAGSGGQGCESPAQARRSRLQSYRARIRQQMEKELQMRAGAENLYRATSNSQVRETVALELGRVNSSLQLLQEELQELGGPDEAQPGSDGVTAPMIPLGLKETKELDWATPLQELISAHFGEDGASYEAEIRELEGLRQAMRTPSRDEAGLELLAAYYNQLCFLDARFSAPARSLGPVFHWYDALTGLPAQQRALAFEKGSVLFNLGALHSQIAARQDRRCAEGARLAGRAFQSAAGAFCFLSGNFSQAPSPDMSAASLCALERLMAAQAQECAFEGLSLTPAAAHDCLAQEAAQVAAEYRRVQAAMAQPPAHSCIPASWTALVQVKAEHFRALAHYHAAAGLCDGARECPPVRPRARLQAEPGPGLTAALPTAAAAGSPPSSEQVFPAEPEERRRLAKAHLKRSILGQEEALRLHALCRVLRQVDLLQAAVARALRRSLARYSQLDREDDFSEVAEAPDIQPKTQQKPEVRTPSLTGGKGTDLFHRLEPVAAGGARAPDPRRGRIRPHAAGRLAGARRGGGPRGPGCGKGPRGPGWGKARTPAHGSLCPQEAGLKEGDYIVSVNGQPCRWWKHTEVVAQLRAAGEAGASLQVVSLLPGPTLPAAQGDRRPALPLRSQRQRGGEPAPAPPSPRRLLGWSRTGKGGKTRGPAVPRAATEAAVPSPERPGQL